MRQHAVAALPENLAPQIIVIRIATAMTFGQRASVNPRPANMLIVVATIICVAGLLMRSQATSAWAAIGPDGRLVYQKLPTGDQILDFSYAGYMGGGVKLPSAPKVREVTPSGGDDTAAIQVAVDAVATGASIHGIRGAVVLGPGTFHCSAPIRIKASGVVLRGSGSGNGGTEIELTGQPHVGVSVAGTSTVTPVGDWTTISSPYVPAGSRSIEVADGSGVQVGDTVQISKPVTDAWLEFMGMDKLERDGKPEHWVSGSLKTERLVTAVTGNRIALDVPLTDDYDSKYAGPDGFRVVKVTDSGRVDQVGVEHLRIVAPTVRVTLGDPEFDGVDVAEAQDSWLQDLSVVDAVNAVKVGKGTRRMTIEKVDVLNNVTVLGSALPFQFLVGGTQVLFDQCSGSGDRTWYFATDGREQGPNVILNSTFRGNGHIQPHQRWSTGLLVDGCSVLGGGIDLMNRGEMGTGHGWTIGWAVAWNCQAKSFVLQQPPGSMNWGIGDVGKQLLQTMPTFPAKPNLPELPQATIDSQDRPVAPTSLYLAQLRERLGESGVRNSGY